MWDYDDGKGPVPTPDSLKTLVYSGAVCTLGSVFSDYEEMTMEPIDLEEPGLDSLSLANRGAFAAETFLMVMDDSFKCRMRSYHQSFLVQFLVHSAIHAADDETLRAKYILALKDYPFIGHITLREDDAQVWLDAFGAAAEDAVPKTDYLLAEVVLAVEEYELESEGSKLAMIQERHPNYFMPYSVARISSKIDLLVAAVRETIHNSKNYPV